MPNKIEEKPKHGKQRRKKLKLGYAPGLEHFKIAAEVRTWNGIPTSFSST